MTGVTSGVTKSVDSQDDDRTTDIGLFNYAASYRAAADSLEEVDTRATHPEAPQSWLYCHAIELYLKSHLRAAGLSVSELKSRRYGHDLMKLREAHKANG